MGVGEEDMKGKERGGWGPLVQNQNSERRRGKKMLAKT